MTKNLIVFFESITQNGEEIICDDEINDFSIALERSIKALGALSDKVEALEALAYLLQADEIV